MSLFLSIFISFALTLKCVESKTFRWCILFLACNQPQPAVHSPCTWNEPGGAQGTIRCYVSVHVRFESSPKKTEFLAFFISCLVLSPTDHWSLDHPQRQHYANLFPNFQIIHLSRFFNSVFWCIFKISLKSPKTIPLSIAMHLVGFFCRLPRAKSTNSQKVSHENFSTPFLLI